MADGQRRAGYVLAEVDTRARAGAVAGLGLEEAVSQKEHLIRLHKINILSFTVVASLSLQGAPSLANTVVQLPVR